jgi:DNA-directed RNA polymerase specialized sigma24 family protein
MNRFIFPTPEDLTRLARQVEVLPAKTRMAFMLMVENGFSYREVGARLGIETSLAETLVQRALEYLAEVDPLRLN